MQQKCCDCFCGREQNPNIISQSASLHSSHTWSGRCNVWYWLISLVSAFQSTKTPGLKTHRVCQTYGPCVRTTVVSWWLQHVFCGFNLINVVSGRKHVTTVLKKPPGEKQSNAIWVLVLEVLICERAEWSLPHPGTLKMLVSITEKMRSVSFSLTYQKKQKKKLKHFLCMTCLYALKASPYTYKHNQLLMELMELFMEIMTECCFWVLFRVFLSGNWQDEENIDKRLICPS